MFNIITSVQQFLFNFVEKNIAIKSVPPLDALASSASQHEIPAIIPPKILSNMKSSTNINFGIIEINKLTNEYCKTE